jgi:arylsulfatase A-like enzyme
VIAWVLAACHQDRVDTLTRRVHKLQKEVVELNQEADELQALLDKNPPPTASVREDHDPPGFDASKPLPAGDPQRPDVIVLSIDTLRADHLGTYGYSRDTSPYLDRLASQGAVFEDMWSAAPWTLPSHTTILSGRLPIHHGTIEDHLGIAPDVPLIQEAFHAAGYRTGGVVATLFVSSHFGFDRGFDWFQDFGIRDKETNNLSTVDADHVFHNALDWAQRQPAGQPIYLFLHVYDAHYKYDAPPPWDEKFDRKPRWGDEAYKNYEAYLMRMIPRAQLDHQVAQYDEEVAYVDAMFGEFLDRWRSQRRATVMVTADHGEEFGERGSWGHAHTVWPEVLKVPWIVNGPGIPARRIADRAGSEDIAPTLAKLAEIPFPSGDGVERVTEMTSGQAPADHLAAPFAETSRFDSLVYRWHEATYDLVVDLAHGARALCELASDPGCKVNLYAQRRDQGEALFTHLTRWLGEPWQARIAGKVMVSEGVLFQNGQRKPNGLIVNPGDRFGVQPGDASVRLEHDGTSSGPWRPFGGTVPGDGCPMTFDGRFTVGNELPEMSAGELQMLEALGYVHADDPDAAAPASIEQGPRACRP